MNPFENVKETRPPVRVERCMFEILGAVAASHFTFRPNEARIAAHTTALNAFSRIQDDYSSEVYGEV